MTSGVVFLGLHALEPGLSPWASLISDYSQTDHAGWATAAFVAFGVVWGAMAAALAGVAGGRSLQVGRALFVLAMLAIVVAAAAILLLVATIAFLLQLGLGGVGQRILFLVLYAWVWTAARNVMAVAAGPVSRGVREPLSAP